MELKNGHMNKARKEVDNEFYTYLDDVKNITDLMKEYLVDKIIYCNCDDYRVSNFYLHLKENFIELKLKELRATNYSENNDSYYAKFDGINETIIQLNSDGSFDSDECISILKESDVVMTNPPFSLKIRFLDMLLKYNKDFIFLCPFFSFYGFYNLFIDKIKFIGKLNISKYYNKNGEKISGARSIWFNSFINQFKTKLELNEELTEYDIEEKTGIININNSKFIPSNYQDFLLVPTSFIFFENILDYECHIHNKPVIVNGKNKFKRLLIKKKKNKIWTRQLLKY